MEALWSVVPIQIEKSRIFRTIFWVSLRESTGLREAPVVVVQVLPCRHRYHVQCVDQWLLSQARKGHGEVISACPLCHAPV